MFSKKEQNASENCTFKLSDLISDPCSWQCGYLQLSTYNRQFICYLNKSYLERK